VDGAWCEPAGAEILAVHNPATAEVLARVPTAFFPFSGWKRSFFGMLHA